MLAYRNMIMKNRMQVRIDLLGTSSRTPYLIYNLYILIIQMYRIWSSGTCIKIYSDTFNINMQVSESGGELMEGGTAVEQMVQNVNGKFWLFFSA